MPLNEILNGRWHISQLEIAAPAQLAGDSLRNIFGPALGRIEGDDADRATVLAGEEILNNCFEVSGLVVGFPCGRSIRQQVSHRAAAASVRCGPG
jgi:hypothetical protein